ncbi:MAG: hypothetical protein ACRDVD_04510 [Acidimicrobiia bacterium]
MLAAVRWSAVLIGAGMGILALAAVAIILWLVLSALDVAGAVGAATTFGTLTGFLVAGWLAGRRAPFSAWFHGALSALGVALTVVVTSLRGGSPAPTTQVILLALLAIALGSLSAFLSANQAAGRPD